MVSLRARKFRENPHGRNYAQATRPIKTRHQRCLSAHVSRMSDQLMVFCSLDRPLAGSSRRILCARKARQSQSCTMLSSNDQGEG